MISCLVLKPVYFFNEKKMLFFSNRNINVLRHQCISMCIKDGGKESQCLELILCQKIGLGKFSG